MGVNLLPFIDRERLVKAINKADQNGQKLTAEEKLRNRTQGDVSLFFEFDKESKSALQRIGVHDDGVAFMASFDS